MGRIERIWIKHASRGPLESVQNGVLTNDGIHGSLAKRRPITLISQERWAAIEEAAGTSVDPALRRANVMVSGVDLEETTGRTLALGSCRVRILGETLPCALMEESHAGLQELMRAHWGGGAHGEVLIEGDLSVGDPVDWVTQDSPA